MEEVFITKNREETVRLGETFSKRWHLREGATLATIALYGELGSGKTTFVQGLARGLGIKKRIISPTFVIMRTYKLKAQKSKRKTTSQSLKLFYHVDLYRIKRGHDIEDLGLEEILNDPKNLVVIEWAEKIKDLLPKKRIDIRFECLDEDQRKIKILNRA